MDYCLKCTEPLHGETICPRCGFYGEMPDIAHQLRPGTILNGRYLIGGCLGQGGFGITYVGRDLKLDMRVAIKEYYPSGYANRNNRVSDSITIIDASNTGVIRDGIQRFLSEARVLARFDAEPGVVSVHDFFEANQTAYIIMEYMDGRDLGMVVNERCFSADEIFRLMEPVLDTLEKIHASNVIHRDISPDNLMLLRNGRLKLMDFGSARLVDYSDRRSLSVVLKSGYAPEEQYRARGEQGPWTDIYALCATIYKCITGITPDSALDRFRRDTIQWPSDLKLSITESQEAVLKKGMAVLQENRFQSISELRQALAGPPEEPIYEVQFLIGDDRVSSRPKGTGKLQTTIPVTQHAPGNLSPQRNSDVPPLQRSAAPQRGNNAAPQEYRDEEHLPEPRSSQKTLRVAGIVLALVVIGGAFLFASFLGRSRTPAEGSSLYGSSAALSDSAVSSSNGETSSSGGAVPVIPEPEAILCPFDITLDRVSYRMPIPVSELEANGWYFKESNVEENTLDADKSTPNPDERTLNPNGSMESVNMFYGTENPNRIWIRITNPDNTEKPVQECVVTQLVIDTMGIHDIDMKVADSIALRMTKPSVRSAMAGKWVNTEDSFKDSKDIIEHKDILIYSFDQENQAQFSFDETSTLETITIYCDNHEAVDAWLQENLNSSVPDKSAQADSGQATSSIGSSDQSGLNPGTATPDSSKANSSMQDSSKADTPGQDSSRTDTSKQGSSKTDSSKQETAGTNSSKQGSSKTDSSRQETAGTASSKQGSSKTDSSRQETVGTASSKQGSSKTDSSRQETAGTASSKQGSSKTDTSKQESSRTDSSKQGSSKTDSSKQESSRTDSSKQGSSKTDTPKQETAGTDTAKQSGSKADTSRENNSKTDSSKQDTIVPGNSPLKPSQGNTNPTAKVPL